MIAGGQILKSGSIEDIVEVLSRCDLETDLEGAHGLIEAIDGVARVEQRSRDGSRSRLVVSSGPVRILDLHRRRHRERRWPCA